MTTGVPKEPMAFSEGSKKLKRVREVIISSFSSLVSSGASPPLSAGVSPGAPEPAAEGEEPRRRLQSLG